MHVDPARIHISAVEGVPVKYASVLQHRIRFNLRVAVAVVALVAALPSVARAQAITLGPGQQPGVAIDPSGTAYVAWNSTDDTVLYFCRLPESASSCTPTTLPVTGDASARPAVLANGSTVRVLTNRCCSAGSQAELFTSSDGGITFGSPVVIGTVNPSGDAVYGPGNGISLITSAQINSYFQLAPIDGSRAADAPVPLTPRYTYHGVIGIASGKPVVVFDDLNNLAWTTTNGADPNQGASWNAVQQIGAGHDPHLANGPGGLFLLSTNGTGHLELRTFNGSGWTGATGVTTSAGPVAGAVDAFAEGPTGGLSVVFRTTTANPTALDFTGSVDGSHWSAPTAIATDSAIANLRVSEAPNDGTGVAVWDNGSTVSATRHPVPPPPPKPPHVAFSFSPTYPMCEGQQVSLDASASTPGSAPITQYTWTLNTSFPPGIHAPNDLAFDPGPDWSFAGLQSSPTPLASFIAGYSFLAENGNGTMEGWFGPTTAIGAYDAAAILGSSVRLEVTDANGLTDSVTEQLPFRYPSIDLTKQDLPNCFNLASVTEPPSVALSTAALLGGATIAVPLACPAATLCGGNVTLTAVAGGAFTANSSAVKHGARRTIVLGQTRAVVSRDQHAVAFVKLNKLGQALARHGRLHTLRVTVTAPRHGLSPAKTISRVVHVRRARKR
jgi:hypothetical protein